MEAIKKQAIKLREQVAKQQQAVLKHLLHLGNDNVAVDEAELECHQQLQNLYNSTRAAKGNIVRGVEGRVAVRLKQMQIARKLAEDCCKYGAENQSDNSCVARAALQFGTSHDLMENEREALLGILGDQVSKPLRTLINGAPLEDARHLTHRYDKLRHEVEAQAAEVLKRQSNIRESDISAESAMKLRNAEARLTELKAIVLALGREASAAMLSVETQQQQMTYQRLFAMEQSDESFSQHLTLKMDVSAPCVGQTIDSNGADLQTLINKNDDYFIVKVIHLFDAQVDGELSLLVDNYVMVCQVAPIGWSEGECKGGASWFP
ncbi:SH3 domain-containing protein 1 [Citrus sinensis]|uniref:SH3 domain-containing protein 1 n=1 Tax=Citrus sinensis TaxID=2711 RepID=A0ACB8JI81_CITSI|nr:SH3 domain-containing protein 1 [Citrus sinensis]